MTYVTRRYLNRIMGIVVQTKSCFVRPLSTVYVFFGGVSVRLLNLLINKFLQ